MTSLLEKLELAIGEGAYAAMSHAAERLAGLGRYRTTIDGLTVPYLKGGSGPPLVLMHGFTDTKETWLFVAPLLSRHFTLVLPDMPGSGAAGDVPAEAATPRQQAKLLGGLLDHLGWSDAHIGGASMGGGIALAFAHEYTHRVRSVTLVGSIAKDIGPSDLRKALATGDNPLLSQNHGDYEKLVGMVFAKKLPVPRPVLRALGHRARMRHALLRRLFDSWMEAVKERDELPSDLSRLDMPVLVLHGDRDRLVHASMASDLVARIPDARYVELRGVGHMPQIEAPWTTARSIRTFVETAQ